jgi:cellobiose-specific phosphotransferase system component IIB
MKSLTFDEIYQDLKSLEYDYLQPTLDRILAEEPRYIENFNKVFANLTDNAYLELKQLFMEFGLDFIDFNKEIQAKKKSILHIYRFMKNGYTLAPLIASATFTALNDYIDSFKKQKELGISILDISNIHSDETIKMINKINTLLSGTQTNYKYINLQTLKNDYNVKLAQIAKKYRISLGNFRAFVVFEQIFKTNSKKKK